MLSWHERCWRLRTRQDKSYIRQVDMNVVELKFPGDDRELEPHDAFSYELGPFREAAPE